MITLTTTKAKLLFVEDLCPDCGGSGIVVDYVAGCCRNPDKDGNCCNCPIPEPVQVQCERCCASGFDLPIAPSGSTYTFLFTTKQGREEDWKGVVDKGYGGFTGNVYGYVDYTPMMDAMPFETATESALSLQKANGMDVNKNYAVIKID